MSEEAAPDGFARFRSGVGVVVGIAVLGYVAWAVARGWQQVADEVIGFRWAVMVPVLALTLVNYGLRFAKWHYLLRRLGIRIDALANLGVFVAGLAMVISPAKAGELVKPYAVQEIDGTSMAVTIPALVTERVTDGLAVVLLAALGVSTFYADGTRAIWLTLAAMVFGIAALMVEPLARAGIRAFGRLPLLGRFAPRLDAAYGALRACLSPVPLVVTVVISIVAWFAECVGMWLVFHGLGVDAPLSTSTFLYAFATVFGAPSPGGLGMADAALGEGALQLVPGITEGQAVASAILVRFATLWFGVILGALVLVRLDAVLRRGRRSAA